MNLHGATILKSFAVLDKEKNIDLSNLGCDMFGLEFFYRIAVMNRSCLMFGALITFIFSGIQAETIPLYEEGPVQEAANQEKKTKESTEKPKELEPVIKKSEHLKNQQTPIIMEPAKKNDVFYKPSPSKDKFIEVEPSNQKTPEMKIYTPKNQDQQPFYQPKGNVKDSIREQKSDDKIIQQPSSQQPGIRVYQKDTNQGRNKDD